MTPLTDKAAQRVLKYLDEENRTRVLERCALKFPNIKAYMVAEVSAESRKQYRRAHVVRVFHFTRTIYQLMKNPVSPAQTKDSLRFRFEELLRLRASRTSAIWACCIEYPGLSPDECIEAILSSPISRGEMSLSSVLKEVGAARSQRRTIERILSEDDFEVDPVRVANPLLRRGEEEDLG